MEQQKDLPPVNIATFVLDDDSDLLDMVKEIIVKAGITNYNLFTNEKLFLDGLTSEIHVCVVDHFLDKLTGVDVVREIKSKNKGSFVIVYTGMKDPKTIIKYLNSGADRFVDKSESDHLDCLEIFLHEGLAEANQRIKFFAYLEEQQRKH